MRGLLPAGLRTADSFQTMAGPPPGTRHPRERRHLDWELIGCGVRGHALVDPDATPADVDPTEVHLLCRKRLFGLRGGGAAHRAETEHDLVWPATERATSPA